MDLGAILVSLLIALVVKVAVMVLGARIVFKLYGATYQKPPRKLWLLLPPENLPEIRILWWSLVLFLVAELTCGVEIYILFHSSQITSGVHAIVSGVGTGLFALGMYLYLDKKVFRFAETGCLANRICHGCTIHEKEGCKFLLVILLIATFVALATLPSFFVSTDRMYADMKKFTLPFPSLNAWFDQIAEPWLKAHYPSYQPSGVAYYLPESELVIEFRILPALALALALAGIVFLRKRKEALGIRLTVFGFGMLAYTYFEIALYPVTGDVLLGSLGHEVVELWFVIVTAEFLRRSFTAPGEPAAEAPS